METDADRLESIKSLGGQLVRHSSGEFWAIFDDQFQTVGTGLEIETLGPAVTCRSSDVEDFAKDVSLDIGSVTYRVKQKQKNTPAPGWTVVLLKS